MSESDEVEVASNEEEEIDPFAQRIAEKMQIARNVVIQCERMHYSSKGNNSDIENIMSYTGVCEVTISMADMLLKTVKKFSDWFKDMAEDDNYCFVFGSIRSMVLELYTKKLQVVTKKKLISGLLNRRCLRLLYEDSRFKKDILHHGFTWKRLPGTKKTILVEKTDQALKRMEYLTRMKAYRKAGRTIVYVDAYFYYYQIILSPQHGLLHMSYHGIKDNQNQCSDVWMKTLTEALPFNSVVVLKEDPREGNIPTPFTSKTDMITWLSERKIPHDPELHRAELYAIIKKCKHPIGSDNSMYGILKSHDHDILYRPKDLKNLDYLEIMWPGEPSYYCKRNTVVKVKEKTIEEWQHYEKVLISREESLYQEEILLETVVDKLLTLAKYCELSAADLEECDDEQADNEYYSSIILN